MRLSTLARAIKLATSIPSCSKNGCTSRSSSAREVSTFSPASSSFLPSSLFSSLADSSLEDRCDSDPSSSTEESSTDTVSYLLLFRDFEGDPCGLAAAAFEAFFSPLETLYVEVFLIRQQQPWAYLEDRLKQNCWRWSFPEQGDKFADDPIIGNPFVPAGRYFFQKACPQQFKVRHKKNINRSMAVSSFLQALPVVRLIGRHHVQGLPKR